MEQDVSGGSWSSTQMADVLLCRVSNQVHFYGSFPALTLYHVKVMVLVPSPALSNNLCGNYLNGWLLGNILWRWLSCFLMASILYCVKFFYWRYLSVRYGDVTKSILYYTTCFGHISGHPQGCALQKIYYKTSVTIHKCQILSFKMYGLTFWHRNYFFNFSTSCI